MVEKNIRIKTLPLEGGRLFKHTRFGFDLTLAKCVSLTSHKLEMLKIIDDGSELHNKVRKHTLRLWAKTDSFFLQHTLYDDNFITIPLHAAPIRLKR